MQWRENPAAIGQSLKQRTEYAGTFVEMKCLNSAAKQYQTKPPGRAEANRATSIKRLSMTFTANCKRQTEGSYMSQKHENLRFSTCLTLLRSYLIYEGNRQERSLK